MKPARVGLSVAILLVLGACTSTRPRAASPSQPKASSASALPSVGKLLTHSEGTTFVRCPDVSKTLPVGSGTNASAVAITFVLSPPEVAASLSDPVASANGLIPHVPGSPRESVIGGMSARNDVVVVHACGHHVAARSWRVTIDDGSTSASLDTWLYLVRLRGGWKVWGSY